MAVVQLSTKALGSVVQIPEKGKLVPYIVIGQNIQGYTGTLLWRQHCITTMSLEPPEGIFPPRYVGSLVDKYLQGDFLNIVDNPIRSLILTTALKSQYIGRSSDGKYWTDQNTWPLIQRKAFILHIIEMTEGSRFPNAPTVIPYLSPNNIWDSVCAARNASNVHYHTRAFGCDSNNGYLSYRPAIGVLASGWYETTQAQFENGMRGVRPAFCLPSTSLYVDDSGTVTTNTAPSVPPSITVPVTPIGGSALAISWAAASDAQGNLSGYKLERAVNGGAWSQIYAGANRSHSDSITSGWLTVAYRVRAYDALGLHSGYTTAPTRTIYNNVVPGAPAGITVPALTGGKQASISWGAANDDNLAGYKLERSVNSGAWTQIYAGANRSYTDTIIYGWQTVAYRARGYDAMSAHSGYTTGSAVNVFNNVAPTVPQTLSVPTNVQGGKTLTLSWSAAIDPDNNLAGYRLERSVASGAWGQIYQGSATAYVDSITFGWTTVTYRVRAYDAMGAQSAYNTSPARGVINNVGPTISIQDKDMGVITAPFALNYTVDDGNPSDMLTVIERLDGGVINTIRPAVRGATYTADFADAWLSLPNGAHTLAVTVSDDKDASVTRTTTFARAEPRIRVGLIAPIPTQAAATKVLMRAGYMAVSTNMLIEVANNAFDAAPTWEDMSIAFRNGRKHLFSNKIKTASKWGFALRVTVSKMQQADAIALYSITGAVV